MSRGGRDRQDHGGQQPRDRQRARGQARVVGPVVLRPVGACGERRACRGRPLRRRAWVASLRHGKPGRTGRGSWAARDGAVRDRCPAATCGRRAMRVVIDPCPGRHRHAHPGDVPDPASRGTWNTRPHGRVGKPVASMWRIPRERDCPRGTSTGRPGLRRRGVGCLASAFCVPGRPRRPGVRPGYRRPRGGLPAGRPAAPRQAFSRVQATSESRYWIVAHMKEWMSIMSRGPRSARRWLVCCAMSSSRA